MSSKRCRVLIYYVNNINPLNVRTWIFRRGTKIEFVARSNLRKVWLLSQVEGLSSGRALQFFAAWFLTLAKRKAKVSDLSVKVNFAAFYNFLSSQPMDFSMSKAPLRETTINSLPMFLLYYQNPNSQMQVSYIPEYCDACTLNIII